LNNYIYLLEQQVLLKFFYLYEIKDIPFSLGNSSHYYSWKTWSEFKRVATVDKDMNFPYLEEKQTLLCYALSIFIFVGFEHFNLDRDFTLAFVIHRQL